MFRCALLAIFLSNVKLFSAFCLFLLLALWFVKFVDIFQYSCEFPNVVGEKRMLKLAFIN